MLFQSPLKVIRTTRIQRPVGAFEDVNKVGHEVILLLSQARWHPSPNPSNVTKVHCLVPLVNKLYKNHNSSKIPNTF